MRPALIFFALFTIAACQLGLYGRHQIAREERAFERGLYAGQRSAGLGGAGLYEPGLGGVGGVGSGLYGPGVGAGLYQQPGVRLSVQEEIIG